MPQYRTGTVTVANADATVVGLGTEFVANVAAGDLFSIEDSGVFYEVASVTDDTHLELSATYAGAGAAGQSYLLSTGFTPNFDLPEIGGGDRNWPDILTRSLRRIDEVLGALPRASLVQEANSVFSQPLRFAKKVSDCSELPATASGSDLGMYAGVYSSATPVLVSSTIHQTTVEQCGRLSIILPHEYVAGQPVTIRVRAWRSGVPQLYAYVDCEAYRCDRQQGAVGDLVTTGGQTISAIQTDYSFTVTPTAMAPGQILDVRLTLVIDDTGGDVNDKYAVIGAIELLCATKA